MKKEFRKLTNAIIYYSLVIILFVSVIMVCAISKMPGLISVIIGFICGWFIGKYIKKIIKVIGIMRVENAVHKTTMKLMLMLGYSKKEIRRQKRMFNKRKIYMIE